MSIARELYLQGIPSSELEAELLQRAIAKTDASVSRAKDTLIALRRKRLRQRAEQYRQLNRLAASVPPVPKVP